ncbi:S49 family peptidase [Salaquimonas pukyongi]|uniref:S49 family peptidase n=1 Tax=Salaquimonas pukyongi TaxID=2712698 RepID=UPI00096BC437|nr:S49 family peptidase [Salaquimonas pukyongi]
MRISKLLPSVLRKTDTVIPVVRMQGAIMASSSPFRQNLSLAAVAGPLQRAFEMKDAPLVAISINSPGGSPVQSRLIYSRIRELSAEKKKPVAVFVEDVAASGGYMIALAGDEIIADETSIVGSIGVVAATFGFVEAIGKLGVERRVYTAGKNKVTLDPFQPEKKADVDHIKALQKDMHEVFISMVKERRGSKLADDKEIFSGLFWTGREAGQKGLIDGLGHMSAVMKERFGAKTKLRLIQAKRNLLGRPVPSVGVSATGIGSEIAAALPSSLAEAAEERALWARYGL